VLLLPHERAPQTREPATASAGCARARLHHALFAARDPTAAQSGVESNHATDSGTNRSRTLSERRMDSRTTQSMGRTLATAERLAQTPHATGTILDNSPEDSL